MRTREDGFTLIEFVVAIAIVSLLTYAAAMTITMVVRGTQQSNDQNMALRQVQNVGYWLSKDLAVSQNTSPGDDPGTPQVEFIRLIWTDWENAMTYYVSYSYENMAGGLKTINRNIIVRDGGSHLLSSTSRYLAESIVSPIMISQTGGLWTVRIESRARKQTEAREYHVLPRTDA